MQVLLVNMPWAVIDLPSLALGIVKHRIRTKCPDTTVDVMHANLEYVDWIVRAREFTFADYAYFAQETYFQGYGDWVFSSALYDDPHWRVDKLRQRQAIADDPEKLQLALDLHELAPAFVQALAEQILARSPDVVGFTSTFQQNAAALATARYVKRLAPHVLTVMGGANCDGPQGAALHRNFPFVDFVVRGEGEASFPQLLDAVRGDGPFAGIDGVCWRAADATSVVNDMSSRPLPPADIATPDFDGYFERLEASQASSWVEPRLVVEGSRGCWWGEKHHCTFCGLNGSFMEFRSKSPAAFLAEIGALVQRHQILDLYLVDNILDMGYLNSLLPAVTEAGYDLRMFCEIKSNMRRPQLEALYRAGIVAVQPGIESLSTQVLKLMDKGVTGCQNVRLLRDSATIGLSVCWNYLAGFPGETSADYLPIMRQFPILHHLQPAVGTADRIAIERFSPYFNRPELGFAELAADEMYSMIYDLPPEELFDLAYLFKAPARGIDDELFQELCAALREWKENHRSSRLTQCDLGHEIVLVNERKYFDWTMLRLVDPVELTVFRLLEQPHSLPALTRKLGSGPTPVADAARASDLVRRWQELGLVFQDDGQFVHVVPESANQHLLRLDLPGQFGAPVAG